MNQVSRTESIHLDMVTSWLRAEAEGIDALLGIIERNHSYHHDYVLNKLKNLEIELKRIRKYIEVN